MMLFRVITMLFCRIDSIPRNISHIQSAYREIFCGILSVPHSIVMNLDNVMNWSLLMKITFLIRTTMTLRYSDPQQCFVD
jgi:hypothetical protein